MFKLFKCLNYLNLYIATQLWIWFIFISSLFVSLALNEIVTYLFITNHLKLFSVRVHLKTSLMVSVWLRLQSSSFFEYSLFRQNFNPATSILELSTSSYGAVVQLWSFWDNHNIIKKAKHSWQSLQSIVHGPLKHYRPVCEILHL